MAFLLAKGQIISEQICGVLKFSKKANKMVEMVNKNEAKLEISMIFV